MIVGCAIYRDGARVATPTDLRDIGPACRAAGGIAWIGLHSPAQEEFAQVAAEFDLHELAVEDAVTAHQRPKLERYGTTLFCVLRPARYIDETETVEFGELHVFAGVDFVITVRHDDASDLRTVREGLESRPDLLRRGPVAVLHAIMDRVVDDYGPVVAGLENDIDEIEDEVFSGETDASRRIYQLSREVIAFQRASSPLAEMLGRLIGDASVGDEERRYLRDVAGPRPARAGAGRRLPRSCSRTSSTSTSRSRQSCSPRPRTSRTRRSSGSPPGRRSSSPRR